MAISDLPGYVQGYKFTDSAAFYNSTDKYFIDQAGYSNFPASRLEITTGTPSFVDVNSARGMVRDNTVQGYLNPFPMWHGSLIIVMGAPSRFSTNGSMYPLIGGSNATVTSNQSIRYWRVGASDYRHRLQGGGGLVNTTKGDDAIYATCIAGDQENRQAVAVEADGTRTAQTPVADNNKAVQFFHYIAAASDRDYGTRMRFGNIVGTKGNTAAFPNGDSMIICELHFFNSILTDVPTTDVETELTALEAIYG